VATEFAGPGGAVVALRASFEPPVVDLAPGEQKVVQAVVSLDERLTPGAAYSGSFAINGMDGFSVPVVVRRSHSVSAGPEQPGSTPGKPPADQPKAPGSARAPTARKRTSGGKSGGRRR
jgi:hypothetical protein